MNLCFLRFGELPPNGRSKNCITGELEVGVSVYEAVEREGRYQILLPRIDPITIATIGNCYNIAQGLWGQTSGYEDGKNPLYIVEGTIVGVGSDGEPLLSDCKIVKKVFNLSEIQ